MKNWLNKLFAVAFISCLCVSTSASAGIIESTLYDTHPADLPGNYRHSIDLWYFNASSDTQAIFDIMAWEYFDQDLNNDGENTVFDSMIWLFKDDGQITEDDILYINDDGGIGNDGSISLVDSYLDVFLTAGNYVLMVGSSWNTDFSNIDINNKEQYASQFGFQDSSGTYWWITNGQGHADYQLTFSGVTLNTVEVSSPATIWIFMTAIVLIASRRKTRKLKI